MKFPTLIMSSLTALSFVVLSSCDKAEQANTSPETTGTTYASDYPLDVCVVSGKKLGSMGEPFVYNHEGTEVQFCCDGCLPAFKKDPSKYTAKLTAAEVAEGSSSGQ